MVLVPSKELLRRTMIKGVASHFVMQPLLLWFGYPLFHAYGAVMRGPLPPAQVCVLQLAMCQFSECLLFYFSHRLLHHPSLYWIHKQHHEYTGPNGFAAEYAHPLEGVFGNYVPVMLAPLLMGSHGKVWVTWLSWRLLATYERHSGYDLSGSWAGKLGLCHGYGAILHDEHHSKNRGNFGSGMDIFDVLGGTRMRPTTAVKRD
eukprot:Hpha_TRINITY_DN2517_c0_g1::TRINITY_DN2517_c0_g1_i2::g.1514::m.1514/K07750/E1.14.13.72, SC4MOL, ERG25; methylsterol monooxygenase